MYSDSTMMTTTSASSAAAAAVGGSIVQTTGGGSYRDQFIVDLRQGYIRIKSFELLSC